MMKSLFLIAASALAVATNASTTVSVLEFGKSGTVRRTLTKQTHTTVAGVSSFWAASASRGMQQADMTVVPDMFRKPDGAVVVGISGAGVDLESMPTVAALMQSKDAQHVVGKMTLTGAQGNQLLHKVGPSTSLTSETLVVGVKKECHSHKLSSVHVTVDDAEKAASVDAQIAALIQSLSETSDSTIVVHLVVEEEEGAARRRLTSRRLEDEQNEDQDQNEEDGDEENANNDNANGQNGYYGYGYYDAYGNWVTPYKTMFQIQYFNIVLWTSVSLVVILFYVIYKMVDMPMEVDTLLFGESAKMMGD